MRNERRKQEILNAITELCAELQQLSVDSDVKGANKLVGKVVIITVGGGYIGRKAIVTELRRIARRPMH